MRPSSTSLTSVIFAISRRIGSNDEDDGLRRVVDDHVDAGQVLEGADVAALAADDPALHVVGRELDQRGRGLGRVAGGNSLQRVGDEVPRTALRLLRLLVELAHAAGEIVADELLGRSSRRRLASPTVMPGDPLELGSCCSLRPSAPPGARVCASRSLDPARGGGAPSAPLDLVLACQRPLLDLGDPVALLLDLALDLGAKFTSLRGRRLRLAANRLRLRWLRRGGGRARGAAPRPGAAAQDCRSGREEADDQRRRAGRRGESVRPESSGLIRPCRAAHFRIGRRPGIARARLLDRRRRLHLEASPRVGHLSSRGLSWSGRFGNCAYAGKNVGVCLLYILRGQPSCATDARRAASTSPRRTPCGRGTRAVAGPDAALATPCRARSVSGGETPRPRLASSGPRPRARGRPDTRVAAPARRGPRRAVSRSGRSSTEPGSSRSAVSREPRAPTRRSWPCASLARAARVAPPQGPRSLSRAPRRRSSRRTRSSARRSSSTPTCRPAASTASTGSVRQGSPSSSTRYARAVAAHGVRLPRSALEP